MNQTLVMVIRSVITFFSLLIFARMLGKKQISQLTFFDYVVGITVGSISAAISTNLNFRVFSLWAVLATWISLSFIMQQIGLRSRQAGKYLDGEPTVVIMNGQIMEKALTKLRLRVDELTSQLRVQNVFDFTEVEFAVLETNGRLSVLKKGEYQNVTLKDLNLPSQYKGLSTELIYNGVIIEKNLEQLHLTPDWLYDQIKKQGVRDTADVMYASLDTQGRLYIDPFADHVTHVTDPSDYHGPN